MLLNIYKGIILLLLFQSCALQKKCKANLQVQKDVLKGEWIVSREENWMQDSILIEVWRREEYNFPPSRFRKKYILKDNNNLQFLMPGPADKPEWKHGRWQVKVENEVSVLIIEEETGGFTAEIVSLGTEKLELKKQ